MLDLTGHVYGRLTVLGRAERKKGRLAWYCQCSCGTASTVAADDLRSGHAKSCGCLALEVRKTQGGRCSDPLYQSWKSMVARCTNPKHVSYRYYGAKGIAVYAPWVVNFQEFKNHIGPRPTPKHSIDRKDNAIGYMPGNVRWVTDLEQAANRKRTAMVEYQGVTQPLSLLARAHGLCPMLVNKRVFRIGWSVERALTTPVQRR